MPQAVCFDMYGTLFNTASVRTTMYTELDIPAGVTDDLIALWREKQLAYTFQVSLMEEYHNFWELTERALAYALAYYSLDLDPDTVQTILGAYESLDLYPDADWALSHYADSPTKTAILSNGNPEMLDTLARDAGITDRLSAIISADEVGVFKPAPAVYANAADRLGVPLDECWLVSGNAWDVAGATNAGMGAVWVNRNNDPPEQIGGHATHTIDSLRELRDV